MPEAIGPVPRGRVLYAPDAARVAHCRLSDFRDFVKRSKGPDCPDYPALHGWSTTDLGGFWSAIAEFFEVRFHARGGSPLPREEMPGARWFPGYELNYAEHALRHETGTAIVYRDERGSRRSLEFSELRAQVARCRAGLRALGVGRGDFVVGYLGNCPEAVVAFLASASLGAIWSSCPPEFGTTSVLDRFQQVAPKVLIACDGYEYGGRHYDRKSELADICAGLPSLCATVLVERGGGSATGLRFETLLEASPDWGFDAVPFEHPLWVLYSSGTTGRPKAIVQGHGGIVLEHSKSLALHHDLGPGDRFFWFTTTGWMMWNYLVSGLLVGSTIVLYEGSPNHPDLNATWSLIDSEGLTYFGTSAPFLMACRAHGLAPGRDASLTTLRGIGSTGAPLPPEGFDWVYDAVKADLHLGSISGGTDVCTAFLTACPWLPVRAGELQCSALGALVRAYDDQGRAVFGQVGELVVLRPLPSMPTMFWNDPNGDRLRASYFERFPGAWHHGDWLCQFTDGAAVIHGRSDATLNRAGVRMGTSEFYRVVATVPGIEDSLVVDTSALDQPGRLWLFVVLGADHEFAAVDRALRQELRRQLSPRHVPDILCEVLEIPYTLSGKKLEVPVKRLLHGEPLASVVALGTLKNPQALLDLLRRAQRAAAT